MEWFTQAELAYLQEPFNLYDKIYLEWIESIEIKKLTEQNILDFQRKQKENITKLKWEIIEQKNKNN